MTKRFLAANWKMKGSLGLCQDYAKAFSAVSARIQGKVDILACPPSPYLCTLLKAVSELPGGLVACGTQDISRIAEQGAHTGEIHPAVLNEIGCTHSIIGHSERRSAMGEDNHIVGQKMRNCFQFGIVPVLCVGESAEQRESGASQQVIGEQLSQAFAACAEYKSPDWPEVIVAYEPFWAIGSGKAATPDIIAEVHACIRRHCQSEIGLDGASLRILYGGSLNRSNMTEIAATEGVDGGLIGGASLDADHFAELAVAFAG